MMPMEHGRICLTNMLNGVEQEGKLTLVILEELLGDYRVAFRTASILWFVVLLKMVYSVGLGFLQLAFHNSLH